MLNITSYKHLQYLSKETNYSSCDYCITLHLLHAGISEVNQNLHEAVLDRHAGIRWVSGEMGGTGEDKSIDINIRACIIHDGRAAWHFQEAGERHDCRGRASNSIGSHSSLARERKSYTIATKLHVL